MFKKANRFFNGESDAFRRKVEQLQSMGFDKARATNALDAANGDLEQATNLLLTNQDANRPSSNSTNSTIPSNSNNASVETEDQQLQRALEESKLTSRDEGANRTSNRHMGMSAATIRAGQAAASRAQNAGRRFGANGNVIPKKVKKPSYVYNSTATTSKGGVIAPLALHPNVKIPKKMAENSKEEQILRCTKRLAPHPLAVDTLLGAFQHIRNEPDVDKYRKIDRSSAGYQTVLEGKPGALDLLKAMNFVERGGGTMDLVLARDRADPALLYLGISALEQVRETEEYLSEKRHIAFVKDVKKITDGYGAAHVNKAEEEVVKRANFISKVPSEPSGGSGALLQVKLGEEKLARRFDGDDTLKDVVNWIGAHGSEIPDKILSREWSLVDLNRYPIVPMDVEINLDRTLQFIGCWPSGKLGIQPSTIEWRNDKVTTEDMGSSRGLGAAPSSTIN